MSEIALRFEADCDFLTVYVAEAHPKGGWESPDQPNVVEQASSTQERLTAAKSFFAKTGIPGKHAPSSVAAICKKAHDRAGERSIIRISAHRR